MQSVINTKITQKFQKGFSIIEVIFAVFIVCLVFFIGLKFYEAQKKHEEAIKNQSSEVLSNREQENILTQTATYYAGRKVTLKYPGSWKLENREEDLGGAIILSPDKDVYVFVSAKSQKLDHRYASVSCDDQYGELLIKSFNKSAITANPEYSLVETVDTSNHEDAVVYSNSKLKDAVVQASICTLPSDRFAIDDSKGHLSVSISPYSEDGGMLLKAKNYPTARNVVLSMRVEN